jgi:hypothetical protein
LHWLRFEGSVHELFDVGFLSSVRAEMRTRSARRCGDDAVFVRDFSRLDRYSDDDLIKAATILHVVYRSYDLAGVYLREFDRRQAGGLWQRYSSWVKTCDLPNAAVTFATQPTFARKA